MNALKTLHEQGQSPWLDFIRRKMIGGPELKKLIEEDGISGMTSNPAIFEKAIGHSDDYDDQLKSLVAEGDYSAAELFEKLAIQDIRDVADALAGTYERSQKRDGYISLEVSPYLALKTESTIAEAEHLWRAVDRRNLMVKVPATPEGIPAIEKLIGEGININVTLLFSIESYQQVAEAYIRGLEHYAKDHSDLGHIASVASFFVSRIDSNIDKQIEKKLEDSSLDPAHRDLLKGLLGKVAIANAKLAFQRYEEIFSGPRWEALAAKGAQTQRMLWASTGTKNKAYSDVLYIDSLIGPDSVNTMPPDTMDAFRDHGRVERTIDKDVDQARQVLEQLEKAGISLQAVTKQLVDEGVQLFADAADKLFESVEGKRRQYLGERLTETTICLPPHLEEATKAEAESWRGAGKLRQIWAKDSGLWTGADEDKWLGWLDVIPNGRKLAPSITAFAKDIAGEGIKDVLLIGMGGSSLGPEVVVETFGHLSGKPKLHVIDSTDPQQIATVEKTLDLDHSVFIVSSKSGSTLEPNVLMDHFFDVVSKRVGAEKAGQRFVAVTDPGSSLEKVAKEKGFRHIFPGDPTIGGRFSVLSPFGLVPAAAMGVDLNEFLSVAKLMVNACSNEVPPAANPGVGLGIAMGVAGKQGIDKVTILAGPGLEDFGAWAEQLIAESTGKEGKGLIPVDAEPLGQIGSYGKDRFFVHLALAGKEDKDSAGLKALTDAGHPVVRITLHNPNQIAQEFFRWEMATAVAGAILGINTFNQPDVESAKTATRALFATYEKTGKLEEPAPLLTADGLAIFGREEDKDFLTKGGTSLDAVLTQHFARVGEGDYAAFIGFLPRQTSTISAFQSMRLAVRDRYKVATVVGFGPRFLHSTGQAYKGGPNTGVFLQLTCDHAADIAVPGHSYSFATIEKAQAIGDLQVLQERGRRLLRIHLGQDIEGGLKQVEQAVVKAAQARS